jgi:hypothetical protein
MRGGRAEHLAAKVRRRAEKLAACDGDELIEDLALLGPGRVAVHWC